MIPAITPYSLSFFFNSSHFNFLASERNNYSSSNLSHSYISCFIYDNIQFLTSINNLIYVSYQQSSSTNIVNHNALHSIQLLLYTSSSISIRIIPLGHQLTNRRREVGHCKCLSSLGTISTSHHNTSTSYPYVATKLSHISVRKFYYSLPFIQFKRKQFSEAYLCQS